MTFEVAIEIFGIGFGGVLLAFSYRLVSRMSLLSHRWVVRMFVFAAMFFMFAEVVALLQIIAGSTTVSTVAQDAAEVLVMACLAGALYALRRSESDEISDLLRLAHVDELTALPSRSFFRRAAARRLALSQQYELPLACLLIDIDDFKSYNDQFGHRAGDEALRCTARALRERARADDLPARIGGEEFTLLMNGGMDEALATAERIREDVQSRCRPDVSDFLSRPITVSIGVASLPGATGSLDELLQAADAQMYQAKRAGKNRVSTPDA